MNDIVAQIFGLVVLVISASLVVWEIYVFRRIDEDVPWLRSPARLWRRLLMAFLLLCVGLLILCESRGLIELGTIQHLVFYVCSLMGAAFLLLILSLRDLGEMARNAEKYALKDLKSALEEQQRQLNQSSGPPE